jgi:hypothetical protein
MARKVLNRKELREENEAAERAESEDKSEDKTEEKSTAKKAAAKKPTKRKSRAKAAKEVRLKAFWGVFSQTLNPVVLFEHADRDKAEQKASELSESKKSPHFVQLVKKVIEE